jgi:hypothetical protein
LPESGSDNTSAPTTVLWSLIVHSNAAFSSENGHIGENDIREGGREYIHCRWGWRLPIAAASSVARSSW